MISKKINKISNKIDIAFNNSVKMQKLIEELRYDMHNLWKVEDIEENDSKFRWPFDKDGNIMENVSFSKQFNSREKNN